ncbi:hypothetical protein PIB30_043492 [Stylosanthes scabra]|uniref:2-oxoacid dehydrogenase acyltransferase catalytic domain-containing protein n=1 Tax=Stylosanthes scabra TaxID=79078 RepID=A0ABU6QFU7_9FABA|nr:hypothetical protein [Stylosanthes scabra]
MSHHQSIKHCLSLCVFCSSPLSLPSRPHCDIGSRQVANISWLVGDHPLLDPVALKGVVSALQHQPVMNGVIDGDDIIYRDYIHISIAAVSSKGLVPVLCNDDKFNFADI